MRGDDDNDDKDEDESTSRDSWLLMNMALAGWVGSCQATSLSVRYQIAAQPPPPPTPPARRAAQKMASCTSTDARAWLLHASWKALGLFGKKAFLPVAATTRLLFSARATLSKSMLKVYKSMLRRHRPGTQQRVKTFHEMDFLKPPPWSFCR